MKKIKLSLFASLALVFGIGELPPAGVGGASSGFGYINDAAARVGRPATPGSAAGVARRTTRRTFRRGAYIARIPAGCPIGTYYGQRLYYCGGTYYQKSGSGYVIVYF